MNYFNISLITLLVLIASSCGSKNDTTEVGSVSPRLEEGEVIETETPPVKLPTDNTDLNEALLLYIKPSSVGRMWQDDYSQAIVDEFKTEPFSSLFKLEIKHEDLNTLKCPGFESASRIEKMQFFLVLLASIAEAESDFNNELLTKAPNGTTNVGMFQLDVKAANVHTQGVLGAISAHDLRDGQVNSKVAAYVLKNQLKRKGPVIFRGDYYWEVLNPGRGGIKNLLRYFYSHLNELEFCAKKKEL